MSNKTIWIANTKGGVGKTTLSLFLTEAYRQDQEADLKLIDCDTRRKLAAFHNNDIGVTSFDIGATADEIKEQPNLAVSYWDSLAEEIINHDGVSIVDLGANIDQQIWHWAERSQTHRLFDEEDVAMEIFVPITAEPLAVEGGVELLNDTRRVFPGAKRILVLNQADGPFDAYDGTKHYDEFLRMKEEEGLEIIKMPKCLSEGWVDFEMNLLNFSKVINLSTDEIMAMSTMGKLKARRARGDFALWIEDMFNQFEGIVPDIVDERA